MLEFINLLRAIATALITNSHYAGIWPIPALAAGGLLGNVIFFAVSGFCLFEVKVAFPKWYLRRFLRVYPVMAVFTLGLVLTGQRGVGNVGDVISLFVYPTNYIFLVWLMVLYVPFYLVAWGAKRWERLPWIVLTVVVALWLLTYALAVDKTAYVVDDVSSPFIMFLYFSAMLLGALIKKYRTRFTRVRALHVVLTCVGVVVYFVSKLAFSRVEALAPVQIVNQFVILAVLFSIFTVFVELEEKLGRLPDRVKGVIRHLSGMTLHIYVVQFVIIKAFEGLVFPLNLVVVTALIVVGAAILKLVEDGVRRAIALLANAIRKAKNGKA